MRILNLNRIFTYNKALRKINKEHNLTSKEVLILLSVVHLEQATSGTIARHLKRFYHTSSPNDIQRLLIQLTGKGLLSVKGRKPSIYTITMEGENVLTYINDRCALTRIDK